MPRTTTQLSRMSVTAPAPRVVYQRTLEDTRQDPPVTATGVLDDELTPLDGCRALEELEVELELVDDEVADVFDAWEVEADVPGMVAALTAANTPTPATAPAAAPTVRRCSKRKAASRERTLAWVALVVSMAPSLPEAAKPYLRAG